MSESASVAAPNSIDAAMQLVGRYGGKARAASNEAKQHKETIAARDEEIKQLKAANAKLTGDLDAAVKARGTPDEKDAQIAALQAEITGGKHKAAFARAVKAAAPHSTDDDIDDLYTLSGHKAEGAVDEAKIGELVTGLKTSKPRFFAPPAAEAPKPGEPPAPKPVPGAGRGGANQGQDGTIITREQRADPAFMLAPQNQKMIREAAQQGRFRE